MPNETNLYTFPKNKLDALTMLYLKNQDLSSLTPEKLFELYEKTYQKINNHKKKLNKEQRENNQGWQY